MAKIHNWPERLTQSNIIQGTASDDVLLGHGGDDPIKGLAGNDKLYGGPGRDTFFGGTGNDFLRGDSTGKGGFADLFVFGKNSGNDVIADFDIGKDMLQIYKGINDIKKAADVLDHAAQKGKDVVVDLGEGNTIRLKNIDLDGLKKNPAEHFDVTKNIYS